MWIGAIEVQAAFWGGSEGPPPQTFDFVGTRIIFEAAIFIITTTALSTPPFLPLFVLPHQKLPQHPDQQRC